MLITPRPGTNRDHLLQTLRDQGHKAENLRSPAPGIEAAGRLLRYLEWATEAARMLRHQISEADIDRLVLTSRYRALLSSCGTLTGERLINNLVDLELAERAQALEEAASELQELISRWPSSEHFVVADSSFYIHHPDKLEDLDLHTTLFGAWTSDDIRLLFPIAVVDELDGLKESGKHRARWRASHTLGVLDKVLNGRTSGVWHSFTIDRETEQVRGNISLEIVLDQPGHIRLPLADDEIIDRAVAIQALAGREVRLLTCDTGQHTRGRAAGLKVTKIPAKDPGPEPDWAAQDKPGTGVRAQRRAK